MERQARKRLDDARVKEVRRAVAGWRRTRQKRTAMPAELWAAAVALARRHGMNPVARALRIDYGSLARRVAQSRSGQAGTVPGKDFIELRGADLLGGATMIEVVEIDGARMTIRIGAGGALDATALVTAFRQRGT